MDLDHVTSNGNSIIVSGSFRDSVSFLGIDTFAGYRNTPQNLWRYDAFITRLSDNAIIRGEVNKGPYCAGDTIRVPYRKIGDYDTGNYFIAELSDEEGNFTGRHRELGRIKTNQDSVVLGKLPLFQVASSKKYRIRIRSTSPAVQSYFKFDTLRLLIYSKDKADPGGDTLICRGDSLRLQTYGGTKWSWSPDYNMADSTSRATMAWPDTTTTYRIIIADSSGCGAADTATKTVYVRQPLSVQFHTPSDTSACIGGTMPLIVSFHGGDSSGYNWQWTAVDSKNNYSFPKSGSGRSSDTLLYTLAPGEQDSVRFSVFLSDGCTPKPAFGLYTLKVRKSKTTVSFKEPDTAICPGRVLPVIASFTGSDASLLSWQWQEANTLSQWINRKAADNKQADTFNYTLPLNWKGNKRLRVILKDNCSGLNDTAVYTIKPRDTLQLKLNINDTTLCSGQTYTWKATGSDGYAPGYGYVWTDVMTGDTLSEADTLRLTATQSRTIRVSLHDGCMPNAISKTFAVAVSPELSAEIKWNNAKANDTILCYGQSISCRALATGGTGSYGYSWRLNGVELSTRDSLPLTQSDYRHLSGTTARLELIVSDGCTVPSDSTSISISLLAPISQATDYPDSICYGTKANFKTTAQGGTGTYSYRWTDANNALLSSSDAYTFTHSTNQTGTLNIHSIVTDGCSDNDTAEISAVLLAPLKLTVTASDSCPENALTLSANVTGGKTGSRQIRWYDNLLQIGTGSSISLNTSGKPLNITAILSDGCSKADTQTISTGARPGIQLQANNTCLGGETEILAASTNATKADSYRWLIDGQLQMQTDSLLKKRFTSAGRYKIEVQTPGSGSCIGMDSMMLEISARPEAGFTYVVFKSHPPVRVQFNNSSLNSTYWAWDFGNGDTSMSKDPAYSYPDTGMYRVRLIASRGGMCSDTVHQTVPVYTDMVFYLPNVFSPDGNGINEYFGLHPSQRVMVRSFRLQVYNRWGELVYSTDSKEGQWTGEGAQQGIYIWKAEVRDIHNVLHELSGVVELLK